MPHFKSINHVEVGYSKIITNPLTIFTEWLLAKFYALKDGLVALAAKLFPRRPKIYGKQMDSWLVGKSSLQRRRMLKCQSTIYHSNSGAGQSWVSGAN